MADEKKTDKRNLLLEISGVIFLLFVWIIASAIVQTVNPDRGAIILPSPYDVVRDFPLFATHDLRAAGQPGIPMAIEVVLRNTLISTIRLLSGIAIGVFLGVSIGLLMSSFEKLNYLIGPVLLFLRTMPLLALLPLFLAWFAGREEGKIIYISFAVFGMIVVNTIEAAKNIPTIYIQYAKSLGASKFQIFRKVTFPYIIPELVGAVSVVVGVSWALLLAAEFLAAQAGLGFMLIAAERFLGTSRMVFLLLWLMVLAIIFNTIVLKAGRVFTRWKPRVDERS